MAFITTQDIDENEAMKRRQKLPFGIYNNVGLAVDTVDATSEFDAIKRYCKLRGFDELPAGWFVECLYA